jgi:hypothetical protein
MKTKLICCIALILLTGCINGKNDFLVGQVPLLKRPGEAIKIRKFREADKSQYTPATIELCKTDYARESSRKMDFEVAFFDQGNNRLYFQFILDDEPDSILIYVFDISRGEFIYKFRASRA